MNKTITHINELKAELDDLLPLNKKAQAKLWGKFRLEWNYNSNHIEGNTLSYGDTKLLFRLGDDFRAQNNSLKDVQEMRAHDVAIEMVQQWANDKERLITQSDIRALNETLLVKPFWADALTPDGQNTRRQIIPGEYKKQPNHVQLKSGRLFKYAEPNEVPQKMQELLDWYSTEIENNHPLIIAAFLHYKFVCIHPFDDGNGRVSRLLMNYHLLRNGYPPVIIKSKDKNNYLYALQQADAGNTDAFIKYVAEQLIWSLELQLRAAKGESIEEEDDLYKEIEVWKKNVLTKERLNKSDTAINNLVENFLSKFVNKLKSELSVFNDLYKKNSIVQRYFKIVKKPDSDSYQGESNFFEIDYLKEQNVDLIVVHYILTKPKIDNLSNPTKIDCSIEFRENKYNLKSKEIYNTIEKHYNETPTEEEVNQFLKALVKSVYEKMKAK